MRNYDDTIWELDATVGPHIDQELRQCARDDVDMSDDMDGIETFLVEAIKHKVKLPVDLLDDVERELLPTAVRPPQDDIVRNAIITLRQMATAAA